MRASRKPSSVRNFRSWVTIYLGLSLPAGSCDYQERDGPPLNAPIPILHRVGFTWRTSRQAAGELLPRLSILTASKRGGISLLHYPWGRPRRTLSGTLPCGARTFLMRGLSALRPRLSDPVAEVLYFICRKKSNGLQFLSHADIIQAEMIKEAFGYESSCRPVF